MKIRSQKGFSLIELMVVVAIIGILSAIAIPNYQRFQRKARQSEARAHLGGIYTTEKAYQAEAGGFTNNLFALGYGADGQLFYNCGWTNATAFEYGAQDLQAPGGVATYIREWNNFGSTDTEAYCGGATNPDCALGANAPADVVAAVGTAIDSAAGTFTVGCAGDIGGQQDDFWTMDNAKITANVQSGI